DPKFSTLIIDSSPAKLPFICSRDADLINLLNVPPARLTFISGGSDTVVKESQMTPLFKKFPQANIIKIPELTHPFMFGAEPIRMKKWVEILDRNATTSP